MDEERRRERFRTFLIGGLVGSVAGLVAAGRVKVARRPVERETPEGLAAFEGAPCYEELVVRERSEARPPGP